ncbi:MAG: hypothetical protein WDM92_11985 [Caulobacteraceae bacterium]
MAAALAVLPIVAILWLAATGQGAAEIPLSLILRYGATSAALGAMVAVGATALGASAAWLVVMYRFPGRSLFAWALVLPLAAPAFAWPMATPTCSTWPARCATPCGCGRARSLPVRDAQPARRGLRDDPGLLPLRLPDRPGGLHHPVGLRAGGGAVAGLQALRGVLAGGPAPGAAALAAGAALAVMETLADYGAVNFLGCRP